MSAKDSIKMQTRPKGRITPGAVCKIPHHIAGIDNVYKCIRVLFPYPLLHFPHITVREHGINQVFFIS